jgi:hypothetical protein
MTESQKDTIAHVAKVQFNLSAVIANLAERSTVHNRSKFEEPELLSGYESLQKSLQGVRYGTPDYRAALGAHEGVIMHHYAANTHHPEHWPNGIAMTCHCLTSSRCLQTGRQQENDTQRRRFWTFAQM